MTLKKARALAIQEFGTAKGLEKDEYGPAGYFRMRFGNLRISIHNDTGSSEGIKISVGMNGGYGYIVQFHNPDTLEEDFEAEERYRREEKRDALKEWVDDLEPEACYAEIDRVWNRRR